jgi:hypothetical protein
MRNEENRCSVPVGVDDPVDSPVLAQEGPKP